MTDKETSHKITFKHNYNNLVWLLYDIFLDENTYNETNEININLSEIKSNILKHKLDDVNTVNNYYEDNCIINVILTYYINKNIAALNEDSGNSDNIIQIFRILYKFTKFEFSIVTNDRENIYKDEDKSEIIDSYDLTDIRNLNIKVNYIQDNNDSENKETTNNQIIGQIETIDSSEEMKIIKFVENETQTLPKYKENENNNDFVREPVNFYRSDQTFQRLDFNINEDYKKIKNSEITYKTKTLVTVDKGPYIFNFEIIFPKSNPDYRDSLYFHIISFISKMNNQYIYEEFKKIRGKLDKIKRNKIKKLFNKYGFDPDNDGKGKKYDDSYGNLDVLKWNYNREYNTLKYFYKEYGNNTTDDNPLKLLMNLMATDYEKVVSNSYKRSIYEL